MAIRLTIDIDESNQRTGSGNWQKLAIEQYIIKRSGKRSNS
jgi:hypothetical protein